MAIGDLSTLAATLRRDGFEARNLGQVGLTIWRNGEGVFVSREELSQFSSSLSAKDIEKILERAKRS